MPTVLLIRHGRTTANTAGILAGWLAGVRLDDHGLEQARTLGRRLADLPLAAVVSSPLERCQQTAEQLPATTRHTDDRLGECRYGAWTGRKLADLVSDPLWETVQHQPSQAVFPAHPEHPAESLAQVRDRAVAAIADWDARLSAAHGPDAIWAAVSHGDVIKALLAEALGTDLDRFQRIVVDPGSVSIVRHTPGHPFVIRVNDTGTDPLTGADLHRGTASGDAAIGGDTGAGADGAEQP